MVQRPAQDFLRPVEAETGRPRPGSAVDAASEQAKRCFPNELLARWLRQGSELERAGLGGGILVAYQRYSPAIAEALDAETALAFARLVKRVAFAAGRQAAILCSEAGARAASRLRSAEAFAAWSALMATLAEQAPESAAAVLERMEALLARVDTAGLEAWLHTGLRVGGGDRQRRLQFFTFADPTAERALLRETGDTLFADMERRLRLGAVALWGQEMTLREQPLQASGQVVRRASFDGGFVRVPPSYPGVRGRQAETLYRAGLAHVAAHLRFGGPRFAVGKLKPLQVALVSLIEDARVEQLAMRSLPGLRRLWLPFHQARAGGTLTAELMLPRLARALIDPDFRDEDAWIAKGRALFFDPRADLADPGISRRIGNLLGNDLGQMRVQFNNRTYVVEPAYRDDNLGLWRFEEDPDEQAPEPDEAVEARRLDRREAEEAGRRERQESEAGQAVKPPEAAAAEGGVAVARLPEWDYAAGRERPQWVTVLDWGLPRGDPRWVDAVLARRRDTVARIDGLVRAAKVSRPQRLNRQPEGDRLDLEACIAAEIDRRLGFQPDPNLYALTERRQRDLSILLLLDVSQSTRDLVRQSTVSVLQLELEAAALLAHALDRLGDPFAIHAFSSNGREELRYRRVKDFEAAYGPAAQAALAGLESGLSTRLGAAMRFAGRHLEGRLSHRRLLLVVTDGEPADVDVADPRYLVEDARRAVQSLAARGIDCFCVGLDSGGDSYLSRIFGRYNAVQIDCLERLPDRLPQLYLRLTR